MAVSKCSEISKEKHVNVSFYIAANLGHLKPLVNSTFRHESVKRARCQPPATPLLNLDLILFVGCISALSMQYGLRKAVCRAEIMLSAPNFLNHGGPEWHGSEPFLDSWNTSRKMCLKCIGIQPEKCCWKIKPILKAETSVGEKMHLESHISFELDTSNRCNCWLCFREHAKLSMILQSDASEGWGFPMPLSSSWHRSPPWI